MSEEKKKNTTKKKVVKTTKKSIKDPKNKKEKVVENLVQVESLENPIVEELESKQIVEELESKQEVFDWEKAVKNDMYSAKERADFEKEYEGTLTEIIDKQVLEGTVVTITDREVVVDINLTPEPEVVSETLTVGNLVYPAPLLLTKTFCIEPDSAEVESTSSNVSNSKTI